MNATGTSPDVSVDRWRACVRPTVLSDLAEGTKGLVWSDGLLVALLEELHTTEEFDRLIGQFRLDAERDAPRLLALALFLRHSWEPDDLSSVVDRVLFPPDDALTTRNPTTSDRGHRLRQQARTSPSGPRARQEEP